MPLPILLICVYQPKDDFIQLVENLLAEPYPYLVLVNDGSDPSRSGIFQKLSVMKRIKLLEHPRNRGKGAALKTGLTFIHARNDASHVVCVDADGQHLPADVLRVSLESAKFPAAVVLGVREFAANTPFINKFGNILTAIIFKCLVQAEIKDTQTGLRAIPRALLPEFCAIENNRYDYETKQLLLAFSCGVAIRQVSITTVYHAERHSHFNKIIDSARIYLVLLKHLLGKVKRLF